tara:strand:+ start:1401 stop:2546 length:1146 start_codon:yes stop_codon:yes gene_type:complete
MSLRSNTNVKFLRKNGLKQERKLFENYFHDLIQNYGLDTTYFRHDIKFPEKIDLTPGLSGLENLIYGEAVDKSFYLSGEIPVYIDVQTDIFELNKFGIQPQENLEIYFSVNDFNTRFSSQLGERKEYKEIISFSGTMPGTAWQASGISYSVPFTASTRDYDEEYSIVRLENDPNEDSEYNLDLYKGAGLIGSISTTSPSASGNYQITSFGVNFDTTKGLKIPINPHIAQSDYYKISGGSYTAGAFGSITVGTSSYTGSAVIGALYYVQTPPNVYNRNIQPNVGDFFRLQFKKRSQDYEITNIVDRTITPDGINPLLGKYVWKCNAVRRIEDNETMTINRPDSQPISATGSSSVGGGVVYGTSSSSDSSDDSDSEDSGGGGY